MMLSVLSSFVIYMQNLTLDAEVQGILYIFGSSRRAEYTIGFWLGTYEKYRTLRMTTQVGFRSTLISHPVSRKHVMF